MREKKMPGINPAYYLRTTPTLIQKFLHKGDMDMTKLAIHLKSINGFSTKKNMEIIEEQGLIGNIKISEDLTCSLPTENDS